MSGDHDDERIPLAWALIFAVMSGILALLAGLLISAALSAIDWTAVLRFVAPTAFETCSIEEILEGVLR
ncbi:MAG: hypothetical protein Q4P24_13730 [Rhodobacterales bacterium]|nr:hypothetical protein [Rhodobacterales bacterium]